MSKKRRDGKPKPTTNGNYATYSTRVTKRGGIILKRIRREMISRGTAASKTGLVRLDHAGIAEHAYGLLAKMEQIDVEETA